MMYRTVKEDPAMLATDELAANNTRVDAAVASLDALCELFNITEEDPMYAAQNT